MANKSSWGFRDGDPISGRVALRGLGGGNRYEVVLAWDDHLRSVVVVKLLRPDRIADSDALSGLARELDMLNRIRHPLIVRAFDGEIDGPRPHVVLEHLEGPRLSTLLRKYGTLPWEQLLPLAVQMCSALHYLGAEGIVHLDVKPSNIIMDVTPRLIDLSVARTVAEARVTDGPIGTDAYMSPEQCGPSRSCGISTASDVWGLGATLYEAIAGHAPFAMRGIDADGEERWPQRTRAAPPLSDKVPDVLARPLMACLDPDPRSRPTAAELGSCFERMLGAARPKRVLGRPRPRFAG